MGYRSVDRKQGESILAGLITPEQWEVCGPVIKAARDENLRFAMGGGLTFSAYTGNRRNTKDMDFFVLPRDQERLRAIMAEHGFEEYLAVPYDPTWSYRGHKRGFIVDLLWRMLNNRTIVDEEWVSRGWEVSVKGVNFRLISPEELLWSKLYILRRERCDWPDILGLMHAQAPSMDWNHLLGRLGTDAPVLGSVMALFRWLCPAQSVMLPAAVWERVGLSPISVPGSVRPDPERLALFDAQDWFPVMEATCASEP